MNLSPDLQEAIERVAAMQGISSEEFIVQTLMEKTQSMRTEQPPTSSSRQMGIQEKEGILVFETDSLDHIDFNDLIAQNR